MTNLLLFLILLCLCPPLRTVCLVLIVLTIGLMFLGLLLPGPNG